MSNTILKPGFRHKMTKVDETELFEIYEFTPSVIKAFPFYLEKISVPYRFRCIQEYFVGYKVFYFRKDGQWAGYCIASNGRNPRYQFCTKRDITFGRYFILPQFRGQGLAVPMIDWVLNHAGLKYRYAYAYVHAGNKASHAVLNKMGALPVSHFDKVGKLRRVVMRQEGQYTVYRYEKACNQMKQGKGSLNPGLYRKERIYAGCIKRLLDFTLSSSAILILSPLFLILTVIGAYKMKGNPFFMQRRPGWHEKIFSLIKFRTMSNARDAEGRLLPDEVRLNKYGKFLRSTSLDELPELFNICKGDMSIIGPRPLLIEYLPWYTEEEHRRHDVRPGLTGWAQVNGRNTLDWDRRFQADVYYVDHISFLFDLKIFLLTIKKVLVREGISENTRAVEPNFAEERKDRLEQEKKGL